MANVQAAEACVPQLLSMLVEDPGVLDPSVTIGDTMTLSFASKTDMPPAQQVDLSSAQVLQVLTFNCGTDCPGWTLSGRWLDNGRQLRVRIDDLPVLSDQQRAALAVGTLGVSVKSGVLSSGQGFSGFLNDPRVVVSNGTWGDASQPLIRRALAMDSGGTAGFSAGDSILVQFDQVVDPDGKTGYTHAELDDVFELTVPMSGIVRRWSGKWTGRATLQLTIDELDTTHALYGTYGLQAMLTPESFQIRIRDTANIRSGDKSSEPCNDTAVVTGDWGEHPAMLDAVPHSKATFAVMASPPQHLGERRTIVLGDEGANPTSGQYWTRWCDQAPEVGTGHVSSSATCDSRVIDVGVTGAGTLVDLELIVHERGGGWPWSSVLPLEGRDVYVQVGVYEHLTNDTGPLRTYVDPTRVGDECVCIVDPLMEASTAGLEGDFYSITGGTRPDVAAPPATALEILESTVSARVTVQRASRCLRAGRRGCSCFLRSSVDIDTLLVPAGNGTAIGMSRIGTPCGASPVQLRGPEVQHVIKHVPSYATSGGQRFSVNGTQLGVPFGPADPTNSSIDHVAASLKQFMSEALLPSARIPYLQVHYGNADFTFDGVDCQVQGLEQEFSEVSCFTSAGIGRDMIVSVTINGFRSDPYTASPGKVIDYAPPVIQDFIGAGSSRELAAATDGGEVVTIRGSNLGPLGVVEFYPGGDMTEHTAAVNSVLMRSAFNDSIMFLPLQCNLTKAHEEIQCYTPPGSSGRLFWELKLGRQRSGTPSTLYKAPVLTGLCLSKVPAWMSASTAAYAYDLLASGTRTQVGNSTHNVSLSAFDCDPVHAGREPGSVVDVDTLGTEWFVAQGSALSHRVEFVDVVQLVRDGEEVEVFLTPFGADSDGGRRLTSPEETAWDVMSSGASVADPRRLTVTSRDITATCAFLVSHRKLVCRNPPGVGAGFKLRLSVLGQSSPMFGLFTYRPPSISSLTIQSSTGVELEAVPTSPQTDVTLHGRDFGSDRSLVELAIERAVETVVYFNDTIQILPDDFNGTFVPGMNITEATVLANRTEVTWDMEQSIEVFSLNAAQQTISLRTPTMPNHQSRRVLLKVSNQNSSVPLPLQVPRVTKLEVDPTAALTYYFQVCPPTRSGCRRTLGDPSLSGADVSRPDIWSLLLIDGTSFGSDATPLSVRLTADRDQAAYSCTLLEVSEYEMLRDFIPEPSHSQLACWLNTVEPASLQVCTSFQGCSDGFRYDYSSLRANPTVSSVTTVGAPGDGSVMPVGGARLRISGSLFRDQDQLRSHVWLQRRTSVNGTQIPCTITSWTAATVECMVAGGSGDAYGINVQNDVGTTRWGVLGMDKLLRYRAPTVSAIMPKYGAVYDSHVQVKLESVNESVSMLPECDPAMTSWADLARSRECVAVFVGKERCVDIHLDGSHVNCTIPYGTKARALVTVLVDGQSSGILADEAGNDLIHPDEVKLQGEFFKFLPPYLRQPSTGSRYLTGPSFGNKLLRLDGGGFSREPPEVRISGERCVPYNHTRTVIYCLSPDGQGRTLQLTVANVEDGTPTQSTADGVQVRLSETDMTDDEIAEMGTKWQGHGYYTYGGLDSVRTGAPGEIMPTGPGEWTMLSYLVRFDYRAPSLRYMATELLDMTDPVGSQRALLMTLLQYGRASLVANRPATISDDLNPATGTRPITGGFLLGIVGYSLSAQPVVLLGAQPCEVQALNSSQLSGSLSSADWAVIRDALSTHQLIVCVAPPGYGSVYLQVDASQRAEVTPLFVYDPPTVASVEAESDSMNAVARTPLLIKGANFPSDGAATVRVYLTPLDPQLNAGSAAGTNASTSTVSEADCTAVSVVGSARITCRSPVVSPGRHDLVVEYRPQDTSSEALEVSNQLVRSNGFAVQFTCPPGMYDQWFEVGNGAVARSCSSCPANAGCQGYSTSPYALRGYFQFSRDEMRECRPLEACVGGIRFEWVSNTRVASAVIPDTGEVLNYTMSTGGAGIEVKDVPTEYQCARGYEGSSCTDCIQGFYRLEKFCEKCPNYAALYIAGFAVAGLALVTVAVWLNRKQVNLAALSIGIDFMQTIAIFAAFNFRWPVELRSVFTAMSASNFNLQLMAPECSMTWDFSVRWILIESLPILLAVICLGAAGLSMLWDRCTAATPSWPQSSRESAIERRRRRSSNPAPTTRMSDALLGVFFTMLYYMYFQVMKTALTFFDCVSVVGTDARVLDVEPGVICDPDLDPVYGSLYIPAYTTLVVYGLGIPALFGTVLWLHRADIRSDQRLRAVGEGATALSNPFFLTRRRFAKLYNDFRPGFIHWRLVLIFRKFCLAFTLIMVDRRNAAFQGALSVTVMFFAYVLHAKYRPFLSRMPISPAFISLAAEGGKDQENKGGTARGRRASAEQICSTARESQAKRAIGCCGRCILRSVTVDKRTQKQDDAHATEYWLESMGLQRGTASSSRGIKANEIAMKKARRRPSLVLMARQAQKSSTYIFDYNRLESGLLIASMLMLLSGLIFESSQFEEGSFSYYVMVSGVSLLIIVPSGGFICLIIFEVVRSIQFATVAAAARAFDEERAVASMKAAKDLHTLEKTFGKQSESKRRWIKMVKSEANKRIAAEQAGSKQGASDMSMAQQSRQNPLHRGSWNHRESRVKYNSLYQGGGVSVPKRERSATEEEEELDADVLATWVAEQPEEFWTSDRDLTKGPAQTPPGQRYVSPMLSSQAAPAKSAGFVTRIGRPGRAGSPPSTPSSHAGSPAVSEGEESATSSPGPLDLGEAQDERGTLISGPQRARMSSDDF